MAGKEDTCCPMSEKAEIAVVGSSEVVGGEAAAAADYSKTNWVEMPLSTLRWVLSMTRETDPFPKLEDFDFYTEDDLDKKDAVRRMIETMQADQDEFFEFQAWVRETYLKNGRVMVPEDFVAPKDELNKALREAWGSASVGDAEPQDRDTDSSIKEVLPSKI